MAVTIATPINRNRLRVAYMYVSGQILVEMCKHDDSPYKKQVTANALPADAEFVGVEYDIYSNTCKLVVQSQSFDEVQPGVMPPILPDVEVTMLYEDGPK